MIRTGDLTRDFGTTRALDHVSMYVSSGSIYGLVGPNGAGKTTILNLLAAVDSPTSGTIQIDTDRVALLPDTPSFDAWLTGREVVELSLNLGQSASSLDVDTMLEATGIEHASNKAVGGYSRGMLQRLGIAATLVTQPTLILLDEPASALDPQGRREVLDLITQLRGTATVVFSSHILGDVQEVCDTVGILRSGQMLFEGSLGDLLTGQAVPNYLVRLREPNDIVLESLRAESWVAAVELLPPDLIRVTATSIGSAEHHLVGALGLAGAVVVSVVPEAPSLEDVFMELVT
jgi:ABC-2 type transport system ATP-binding protein